MTYSRLLLVHTHEHAHAHTHTTGRLPKNCGIVCNKRFVHARACVCTFHCKTRQFLVPLALRGGMGVSGSQLRVVKLVGSERFPCKQLYMAWTLKVKTYKIFFPFISKVIIEYHSKSKPEYRPDMVVGCWS